MTTDIKKERIKLEYAIAAFSRYREADKDKILAASKRHIYLGATKMLDFYALKSFSLTRNVRHVSTEYLQIIANGVVVAHIESGQAARARLNDLKSIGVKK